MVSWPGLLRENGMGAGVLYKLCLEMARKTNKSPFSPGRCSNH